MVCLGRRGGDKDLRADMPEKRRMPWWRWQFSLIGVVFVVLLGWMAWESWTQPEWNIAARVIGGMFFLVMAVGLGYVEWHSRGIAEMFRQWRSRGIVETFRTRRDAEGKKRAP